MRSKVLFCIHRILSRLAVADLPLQIEEARDQDNTAPTQQAITFKASPARLVSL